RHPGPREGRPGPARGRRLDLPRGALRQHQFPDPDVGGKDFGSHDNVMSCESAEEEMSVILGSGEHRYRVVENWAKLPDGWEFRDVAAVAVDSKDRVYVFNRGEH